MKISDIIGTPCAPQFSPQELQLLTGGNEVEHVAIVCTGVGGGAWEQIRQLL